MSDFGDASAKTCAVCGTDCNGIPRAKDKRGRYFCRPCYDHALRQARERKIAAPPAPTAAPPPRPVAARPRPKPAADDPLADLMGLESSGSVVETVHLCPGCSAQLPSRAATCPGCGYDLIHGRKAGQAAELQESKRGRPHTGSGFALPSVSGNPTMVGGVLLVMMLGLFGLAHLGPGLALLYLGVALLLSIVVGIWGLVAAFRAGVGTGLLYMLVPFYAFYFVFARCGNPLLQWTTGIAILSVLLGRFLPGVAAGS